MGFKLNFTSSLIDIINLKYKKSLRKMKTVRTEMRKERVRQDDCGNSNLKYRGISLNFELKL